MAKEIKDLIQHINDGLPKGLQIDTRLATPEALTKFQEFLKSGTADPDLESSLQTLANTLSDREQTYEGDLTDAQYYPKHQYVFSLIMIAMIAEYGLDEDYNVNEHAEQWLTESPLANDLIYPTNIYASEFYFDRTGWVNVWEGYLAKRRIIAAINREREIKEEAGEKDRRIKYLEKILSSPQDDKSESDNESTHAAEELYDILHAFHYAEDEKTKKEALDKIFRNKNDFKYLIELFEKLKDNQDKFLTLDKFSFYEALYARAGYQRLLNAFEQNKTLRENVTHFHKAHTDAKSTTNWQSKEMLLGGAAIGGEIAVFVMEVIINLLKISNVIAIPLAGFAFLSASIFMGSFFYYSHREELFKAKLHEYYYQEKKVVFEDNRTFEQKLYKNAGPGTEGVLAAVGTIVSVFFCSDLITAGVTGKQLSGFLPGKFTYKHLMEQHPDGLSMLFWDMPISVLAISVFAVLLIPAALIGYSIFNGHKTLDGPHCDEFLESAKAQEKACSELPTSNTKEPLRFSLRKGVEHTWGLNVSRAGLGRDLVLT